MRPRVSDWIRVHEFETWNCHDAHGHTVANVWAAGDHGFGWYTLRPFDEAAGVGHGAPFEPTEEAAKAKARAVLDTWADVGGEPGAGDVEAHDRDLISRALGVPVVDASRPPLFTFGRFINGHVQQLRDGTWEWSPDGGFDQGVIPLAPDVCEFLSSVVKQGASRPPLSEEVAREMVEDEFGEVWCNRQPPIANRIVELLLRASRGDLGAPLTAAETSEIIASAPGQIGPGQTPIGRSDLLDPAPHTGDSSEAEAWGPIARSVEMAVTTGEDVSADAPAENAAHMAKLARRGQP